MQVVYLDHNILVINKPTRVLSTDEPGGVPSLARQLLGDANADIRTVHRLDRVVGGLMVLARHAAAASELSKQIRENVFQKEYLAVLHGVPPKSEGQLRDLLYRDKTRHMTMVAQEPGKGIQEAILDYWVLGSVQNMTRVRVLLHTGRTHQIRVQFASRGLSLIGERKYAQWNDPCELALFSSRLCFMHPETGRKMEFHLSPPEVFPWTEV